MWPCGSVNRPHRDDNRITPAPQCSALTCFARDEASKQASKQEKKQTDWSSGVVTLWSLRGAVAWSHPEPEFASTIHAILRSCPMSSMTSTSPGAMGWDFSSCHGQLRTYRYRPQSSLSMPMSWSIPCPCNVRVHVRAHVRAGDSGLRNGGAGWRRGMEARDGLRVGHALSVLDLGAPTLHSRVLHTVFQSLCRVQHSAVGKYFSLLTYFLM